MDWTPLLGALANKENSLKFEFVKFKKRIWKPCKAKNVEDEAFQFDAIRQVWVHNVPAGWVQMRNSFVSNMEGHGGILAGNFEEIAREDMVGDAAGTQK